MLIYVAPGRSSLWKLSCLLGPDRNESPSLRQPNRVSLSCELLYSIVAYATAYACLRAHSFCLHETWIQYNKCPRGFYATLQRNLRDATQSLAYALAYALKLYCLPKTNPGRLHIVIKSIHLPKKLCSNINFQHSRIANKSSKADLMFFVLQGGSCTSVCDTDSRKQAWIPGTLQP